MSEIEDLKAQMAAMIAMMNKQQALHEQEIKDLQGRYSGPSSGPPGPSMNIRIKQPETYDGRKGSVDLWIFQMQQYLLATGIKNDEQAVYLATNLLRGDVATWWRHHFKKITDDEDELPNWKRFERLLSKKFKPVNATKVARAPPARLCQTSSVKAYNAAFTSTILEIPNISEEEMVDRYVRGLKEKVRVEVELREPTDLEEAMRIADRFDTIAFAYTSRPSFYPTKQPEQRQTYVKPLGPAPMEIDTITPRFKKLTDEEREKLRRTGACFTCRHPGHISSQYPRCTNQTLQHVEEVRMKIRKLTPDARAPQPVSDPN